MLSPSPTYGYLAVKENAKSLALPIATYALFRLAVCRLTPVQTSAWIDWLYPPETIMHEVQSSDGTVKRTANEFRDIFTPASFMLEKAYLAAKNTHKYAARRRLAFVNMVQAFSNRLKLPIHDAQMSRRSANRGFEGSRSIMDVKDACTYTAENLKYDDSKPGRLVIHVDTFTHKSLADANITLSDGNIHYIYTWNPTCVAGESDEVHFRYDENGDFITTVEGSAPYRDSLWDFEDDSLVTFSYQHSLSSLPTKVCAFLASSVYLCDKISTFKGYTAVNNLLASVGKIGFNVPVLLAMAAIGTYECIAMSHKVIRHDVGEHRSAVAIVPNCKFTGLAVITRPFLLAGALKRRLPTILTTNSGHDFLVEKRKKPSGYSVAYMDSSQSHFLSDSVIDVTKCLTTDKGAPSIPNVRITTKYEGFEANRVAVALAISMSRKRRSLQSYSDNYGYYPLPTIIRQDDESKADGTPIKPVMAHGAMPPIVTGAAYIHAKSEEQTRDFVQRRLRNPAGKVKSVFTPETVGYIAEFAAHIRAEVLPAGAAYLEPISEEEYIETRTKNQLNKFNEVITTYDIHNFDDREGFMKREVLPDPTKAARGICCFPASAQGIGGRISLAYATAMKQCPWMACGLNPEETTAAVATCCVAAQFITDTDFSAQDATIDENKRHVELMLLLQLFDPEWHDLIEDWHYTDYCGRVLYGDKGTKREPHEFNGSRGSGSPFTTLGNTPLTGLFAYIALRLSGKSERKAWHGLGIYSGDDGITADLPIEACDQAALVMGFLVKPSVKTRFIPFLGRNYLDPIGGHLSSIQSPLRTIAKLHTTLINIEEFTAEEAMLLKAICLQVTDRDSDFFGPWSKKVLSDAQANKVNSIHNLEAKVLKYPGLHPYFAVKALNTKTTFENHQGDFYELFEEEMPGFDWSVFEAWLKDGTGPCPTLWDHPAPSDEAMVAVGPVTLAMGGVDDHANMLEYPGPKQTTADVKETFIAPPKASKKKLSWSDQHSKPLEKVQIINNCKNDRETQRAYKRISQPTEKVQRPPQTSKRTRKPRSAKEQKELMTLIEAHGLLEEYRAAQRDNTDPEHIQKEKRSIRDQIVNQVRKPVHTPRPK